MRWGLAFALFLVIAGPVHSAAGATFQQSLEKFQVAAAKADSNGAMRAADSMLRVAQPGKQTTFAQYCRLLALLDLNRPKEAVEAARLVVAGADDEALVKSIFDIGINSFNVEIAQVGAEKLLSAYPNLVREIPSEDYYRFSRAVRKHLGEDVADDYNLRFVSVGLGAGDLTFRGSVVSSAVQTQLNRRNDAEAQRLSAMVDDVQTLSEMLTLRKFEKLWPLIEARVGAGMQDVAVPALLSAETALREAPDSVAAKHNYLGAAVAAGKLPEADKVAENFASTPEDMSKIDEAGGWFINDHVMVLRALKRTTEADARFGAMRVLPIEKAPWMISMIINRAEYLVRDGAYQKANPLVAEAENLSKTYGSPYAQQLVRRLKLCIAAGERLSTDAALADLIAHKAVSLGVTAEGLMCVGNTDGAAELVVSALQNSSDSGPMVSELQPPETVRDHDPSIWRKSMSQLLNRPDVRSAFDKVGRVLPKKFWPQDQQ